MPRKSHKLGAGDRSYSVSLDCSAQSSLRQTSPFSDSTSGFLTSFTFIRPTKSGTSFYDVTCNSARSPWVTEWVTSAWHCHLQDTSSTVGQAQMKTSNQHLSWTQANS